MAKPQKSLADHIALQGGSLVMHVFENRFTH